MEVQHKTYCVIGDHKNIAFEKGVPDHVLVEYIDHPKNKRVFSGGILPVELNGSIFQVNKFFAEFNLNPDNKK